MGHDFYNRYAVLFAGGWLAVTVAVTVFAVGHATRRRGSDFFHRLTLFAVLSLAFLRVVCTSLRVAGNLAHADTVSDYASAWALVVISLVCIELRRGELRDQRGAPPE